MAEGLELGAAIHLGAFIQIFRDIEEERVQHPQSEGLVDCNQHDDGGGPMPPKVPFKKRQKVAETKVICGIARNTRAIIKSQNA